MTLSSQAFSCVWLTVPVGKVLCLLSLTAFFPSVISTCYLSESGWWCNRWYSDVQWQTSPTTTGWNASHGSLSCWSTSARKAFTLQQCNHQIQSTIIFSPSDSFFPTSSPSCSLWSLLIIDSITSRHHSRALDSRAGAPVPLTPKPNLPQPALVCVEIM